MAFIVDYSKYHVRLKNGDTATMLGLFLRQSLKETLNPAVDYSLV